MPTLSTRDVFTLSACVVIHLVYRFHRKIRLPFPPGPYRWPLIGNTLIMPLSNAHIFYKKLGEEIGSKIMYLEALGQSIIVINDITIAQDLLEKRSALYSSRPSIPMFNDVAGVKNLFALMPYGDEWRAHRRMFQQHFSTKYLPWIEEQTIECLKTGLLPNLVTSPDDFFPHIRKQVYFLGSFSLMVTYGLPTQLQHDPFIEFVEETMTAATAAAAPGRFLVNVIPWLKYIPEWMPGTTFKQVGKQIRKDMDKLEEEPYRKTVKMMEDGTAPVSFISVTLERLRDKPQFEHHARYAKQTATQVFQAASETTVSALMTFILGMLVQPDVQLKAQQEVDSVVGPDRLPEYADVANMPYLSAVIKEVLRWNPPLPTGVPHTTSTDDVYMGYYIPKDCIIFPSAYGMLHDEKVFPDPEKFMPERFMKDGAIRTDLPDPETVAAFGFGRRVCPGSHIARSILYITTASLLYLFDFSPAIGDDGHPIIVEPRFRSASIISEPLPFPCKITSRAGKDPKKFLEEYLGKDQL